MLLTYARLQLGQQLSSICSLLPFTSALYISSRRPTESHEGLTHSENYYKFFKWVDSEIPDYAKMLSKCLQEKNEQLTSTTNHIDILVEQKLVNHTAEVEIKAIKQKLEITKYRIGILLLWIFF